MYLEDQLPGILSISLGSPLHFISHGVKGHFGSGVPQPPRNWGRKLIESRWWQLKYFWNFHPYLGKIPIFEEHIFQMAWKKPPTSHALETT